jgi:hypothetical protein
VALGLDELTALHIVDRLRNKAVIINGNLLQAHLDSNTVSIPE